MVRVSSQQLPKRPIAIPVEITKQHYRAQQRSGIEFVLRVR
jgi:hypothetical protein